jgi:purine-cytosine permease-like protein
MTILHATASIDPAMVVVLAFAGLSSAVVVGLALAAFLQRRSRPYLLILLALATLLARTAVPGLEFLQLVSPTEHHILEHALDVVMAALVIAAVYNARSTSPNIQNDSPEVTDD